MQSYNKPNRPDQVLNTPDRDLRREYVRPYRPPRSILPPLLPLETLLPKVASHIPGKTFAKRYELAAL